MSHKPIQRDQDRPPAGGGPVMIGARGLSLGYGSKTILSDVTFEIRAGDWWWIAGANGSGKTTLVHALLGLIKPRRGSITRPGGGRASDQIGYVPQRCDFNHTLPVTVNEFVLLGLTGLRLNRSEERERLAYALDVVDLREHGDEHYWSVSGGQRQRAILARALIRKPPVLILDEPTNELDVRARRIFLHLLETIHRDEGVTILMVTHQIELAQRYGSHALIVADGGIHAGLKHEILTQEKMDRFFAEHETETVS